MTGPGRLRWILHPATRHPVEIVFDSGIYLPDVDLWLDPTRARGRAVVSSSTGKTKR